MSASISQIKKSYLFLSVDTRGAGHFAGLSIFFGKKSIDIRETAISYLYTIF